MQTVKDPLAHEDTTQMLEIDDAETCHKRLVKNKRNNCGVFPIASNSGLCRYKQCPKRNSPPLCSLSGPRN